MQAMFGRPLWILSLSLVLANGCGKNTPPTHSPGAGASASTSASESDEATAIEDSPDGAESESDSDAIADAEDAVSSREALLKLKLERKGKTLEHPGYMVQLGEEVTILMNQGSHTHEIDFVYETGESGYDVQVTYRDNGRKVLQKSTTVGKQQWVELKSGDGKTVLSVNIDPDAGRVEEVEMVGGDDPLGGV